MVGLRCSGAPFQVGVTHGRTLGRAVAVNVSTFWARCAERGWDRPALFRQARRLEQDYSDALLQEIYGIARGSGLPPAELVAFNLLGGAVFPEECTVLLAMGDATANGRVLFVKNSDKIGSASMTGPGFFGHKEINILLVLRAEDGPAIVGVAAAGSTGLKMGASDLGMAVGTNIARTIELGQRQVDTSQMRALDRTQLAREGLQKTTALEAASYAAARMAERPTATPGNLEFVDARVGAIVEGSYDRVALQVVRSGIASRANAFVVMRELNDPADVSSYCRYVRTQELLRSHHGRLTPDLLRRFSCDHANGPGPNSICRHGTHFTEETSQSSMVVEIDPQRARETRFWLALGKPCHAWRNPEGCLSGRMDRLDTFPEGFLDGEVWKRFWTEAPNWAEQEPAEEVREASSLSLGITSELWNVCRTVRPFPMSRERQRGHPRMLSLSRWRATLRQGPETRRQ